MVLEIEQKGVSSNKRWGLLHCRLATRDKSTFGIDQGTGNEQEYNPLNAVRN
jgi:hypothetical protein